MTKRESKKKDKKEERKTRERERQRKRNRKRGRPKKVKGERKRNIENKQKMPFLGENSFLCIQKQRKESKEKKLKPKRNKKKIRRVQGQVRWPFGPPHLTLKPSKKKPKNNKKQKQKNKEGLGPSEVALWATSPDT